MNGCFCSVIRQLLLCGFFIFFIDAENLFLLLLYILYNFFYICALFLLFCLFLFIEAEIRKFFFSLFLLRVFFFSFICLYLLFSLFLVITLLLTSFAFLYYPSSMFILSLFIYLLISFCISEYCECSHNTYTSKSIISFIFISISFCQFFGLFFQFRFFLISSSFCNFRFFYL